MKGYVISMIRTETIQPSPPERVVVKSVDDLLKKLDEADQNAINGNHKTIEEVRERLNEKYGLQL